MRTPRPRKTGTCSNACTSPDIIPAMRTSHCKEIVTYPVIGLVKQLQGLGLVAHKRRRGWRKRIIKHKAGLSRESSIELYAGGTPGGKRRFVPLLCLASVSKLDSQTTYNVGIMPGEYHDVDSMWLAPSHQFAFRLSFSSPTRGGLLEDEDLGRNGETLRLFTALAKSSVNTISSVISDTQGSGRPTIASVHLLSFAPR